MENLLLVDGNAILHRAYHALPPLTNSQGEIVNAIYGFFSMLLSVSVDVKPKYLAVCFDRPKPTFRKELYSDYQKHRPKMDDDLVSQIDILHEMLSKMNISVFERDTYEADDLLGTIVRQVGDMDSEINVVILTGDRDMLQLVSDKVRVLSPIVGVKKTVLYDINKVEEKYGISPMQIVDYKALVGDASDGYHGVSGIGPKTAANLLKQYNTLENVYEHLSDINPKVVEKLTQSKEHAVLSKKLAKILEEVPINFKLEDANVGKFNINDWNKSFEEQGFKTLIKRVSLLRGSNFFCVFEMKEEKNASSNKQLELLGS